MKPPARHDPHVMVRGRAAGAITRADIERRARELALIRDGHEDLTADDLRRAEQELMGDREPASTTNDAEAPFAATRDPSDPVTDRGAQSPMVDEQDNEETNPERLAQQGVEEAQHDQMVEARKRAREQAGPET